MKNFIKLMRPKHYIKNLLIFIAIIFSGNLFHADMFWQTVAGFIIFNALASAVYIFNDIHDVDEDKRHPVKRMRPIASGAVSIYMAYALAVFLTLFALAGSFLLFSASCFIVPLLYFFINLGYSVGLKHIPFLDIALLISGFFLRVVYGAFIINVELSNWVYLTVIALSIYLGLGKRRNELLKNGQENSTRPVLKYYSASFCDKFMNVCLTCAMVFYALWSVDPVTIQRVENNYLVWTVPLAFFILMKYCSDIEADSYGDPVDVLFHDKILIAMCLVFGVAVLGIVYFL